MPNACAKPCRVCGRAVLDGSGYCHHHLEPARQRAREARAQADEQRPNSTQRGYGSRWQRAREAYLRAHPLCECRDLPECAACRASGRVVPAEVVDHRTPHRGDRALFWDSDNWQAMPKACHDRKTALLDGGLASKGGGGGDESLRGVAIDRCAKPHAKNPV